MNTSLRTFLFALALLGLPGAGTTLAANDVSAPGIAGDTPQPRCTVENRRGERREIVVPAQLTSTVQDLPLRVMCDPAAIPAVAKTLQLRSGRWSPVTVDIDGVVMASIDPLSRNRDGAASHVTVSFYSARFRSIAAFERWYDGRKALIGRNYTARTIAIAESKTPCKFSAACNDKEDELDRQRAMAEKDLDRVRALIAERIAPTNPAPTNRFAEDATPPRCETERRRGKRNVSTGPARLPIYWREMPLQISCGTPGHPAVSQRLRMPRDRWLPITLMINEFVMATLEPAAGYRFRKPARMTLTLQPVVFESPEALNSWYETRKMKIEEGFAAKKAYLLMINSTCQYDASCASEEAEVNEEMAAALKALNKLKLAATLRPAGMVPPPPAGVVISDGDKKLCLVKVGNSTWKSGPCVGKKPAPEMKKIIVNGKTECIFRVDKSTWESRACPN